MTETNSPDAQKKPTPSTTRKIIAVGAVGAVLMAGVATAALSHGGVYKGMRHIGVEAAHYGGMVHKARFFHSRPKTVEEAQKRAERMAKHLAIEIDATDEQTDKLVALARGVAGDVFPMRESIMQARKEGLDLLSAEQVDRTKLEALRTEQFAKFEAISKRLTTALVDAAEVLKPEQRKDLAERVEQWRGHGGPHRGWGGPHGGWGGPPRSE